jgi:DNA-binding PadR family transcriptional regulator
VNKLYERFLREFMDVLIMVRMREGETSGYGILTYFHKTFDFRVSSSTVYSMLYSMERDGLIKARGRGGRRAYSLTQKGEAVIEAVYQSSEVLENFFTDLLSGRTGVL